MAKSPRAMAYLTSDEETDDRMKISDGCWTSPSPNPGSSTDEDEMAILEAEDMAIARDTRYRSATLSYEDEDEEEEEEEDIHAVRVRCARRGHGSICAGRGFGDGDGRVCSDRRIRVDGNGDPRRLESDRRLDLKLDSEIMPARVGRPGRGSSMEQKAAASANRDGMEKEMVGLSQSNFDFFRMLLPGKYEQGLRLPKKFAQELGDRRDLKLRLASTGMPLWDVDVFTDDMSGDVYLAKGWKEFACAHSLRDDYLLVFRYNSCTVTLAITVFDRSTCRKQYMHTDASGGGKAGQVMRT